MHSSPAGIAREEFAPRSARRLLVLAGIGLILLGMIFGDIFAVFVLHQNAARVGASLSAASHAALNGDAGSVLSNFQDVGAFLENRGTKVDSHVHIIAFGYLALLLALVEPWIVLSPALKKNLAWLLVFGAGLLPVCVFLIHYVGLAYSPLNAIGWASILADLGGLFVLAATIGYLAGLARYFFASQRASVQDGLLSGSSAPGRLLLGGGVILVLLGFLHGSYYAAFDLYRSEALDYSLLSNISAAAASQDAPAVEAGLAAYGQLQGDKAVNIAAHAHIIEFGVLAMLLAFFQPLVDLGKEWKRRWALLFLLGSLGLPVFVLLEIRFGLLAGGLADLSGLLVIVSLVAIWIGVLRHSGRLDAEWAQ